MIDLMKLKSNDRTSTLRARARYIVTSFVLRYNGGTIVSTAKRKRKSIIVVRYVRIDREMKRCDP